MTAFTTDGRVHPHPRALNWKLRHCLDPFLVEYWLKPVRFTRVCHWLEPVSRSGLRQSHRLRIVTTPARTPQGAGTASRQLAAYLRALIASGDLAPGDKLPSERALAAQHDLARNTAREAIRQLAESGLVTAQHGRGVFVRGKPRLMRFGQRRYSKKLREETGVSPFHAEVLAPGPRAFREVHQHRADHPTT